MMGNVSSPGLFKAIPSAIVLMVGSVRTSPASSEARQLAAPCAWTPIIVSDVPLREPCKRTFNERTGTPFNFLDYPTDIVLLVVLWRLRYKLSLRDLAEMFLERGFPLDAQRDKLKQRGKQKTTSNAAS